MSCSRPRPGSPGRPDVAEIITLLLAFGTDPNQRGLNDYTALHMAVCEENLPAVELLLGAGADPRLRTRIDSCETPREIAETAGLGEIAELLAAHEARLESDGNRKGLTVRGAADVLQTHSLGLRKFS